VNVGLVVPVAFGVLLVLVGLGLVTGGVAMLRRAGRAPRTRVPVGAVVVHRTSHVRPSSVTFDHPVPGGWLRTRKVEGLPVTGPDGRVAVPGDRITVWADPANPADVRLSAGSSPASMGGVALVLAGVMAAGLGVWFAVTVAVLTARSGG